MSKRHGAAALVGVLFILGGSAIPLGAQRPKEETSKPVRLVLSSGEKTSGTVLSETPTALRLTTALGTRVIAPTDVVERADATALLEAYARRSRVLQDSDVSAREALAQWCREEGLVGPYATEIEKILSADPARESVRKWSAEDAGRYEIVKNPQPVGKPRWTREQSDLLFLALGSAGLAQAAVIRAEIETFPEDVWLGDAVKFTKDSSAAKRWVAVGLLGRTKDTRRVKPLYLRALTDPKAFVRRAAVHSLAKNADATLARPFVAALERNDNAAVRIFAAEALGEIGDPLTVEPLVKAMEDAGARRLGHRNITVLTQTAYVKDFDVEVAQGAVIADPIVDVMLEGVVLDAALISVSMERRVIGRALTRIVGLRLGDDAAAWRAHLKSAAAK